MKDEIIITQEEIEKLPLENKPSKLKKFFITLTAVCLIFLVMSFVWMNYGLGDILLSLFTSKTLQENAVSINRTSSLVFKYGAYNSLIDKYSAEQSREFKACLIGEKDGGNYVVRSVIIPEMIEQSFNQVVSKPCPQGTVAELHSHPYRRCLESEQDVKTKELTKRDNLDVLMVIMCEKDRFSFY
ncbi:hypothetical protein FJZ53_05640 [Candidatus Woesearchaeota archaeon]|nr:hypothetical protein [Candidatus Woesearchaeota archaeon]